MRTASPGPTDVEATLRRVLQGFAAELQEVLTGIHERVAQAASSLQRQAEGSGELPARIAEGMATIGEAVGEAAAAQAMVNERLEKMAAGDGALRDELLALREDVRSQVATLRGEVKGMLDGMAATILDGAGDRREAEAAMAGRLAEEIREARRSVREDLERAVGEAMDGVRRDVDDLRARIEAWGTPRSAPKLARDLGALEDRVDELTSSVRDQVVEAVSERMEHLLELRFEALVQVIESRVRHLVTTQPENGRRAGLFRRSAV
ncbi:MAG: hypothetical protein ACRDI0_09740 [Actinomycetota bacterium]